MSSPALAEAAAPAHATPVFHLHLEDTLAAGNRLWIRGQVSGSSVTANGSGNGRSWWKPWRKEAPAAPTALRLDARVSGSGQEVEVPISADGRFEAQLTVPLPVARRGWLVARNRVQLGTQ